VLDHKYRVAKILPINANEFGQW